MARKIKNYNYFPDLNTGMNVDFGDAYKDVVDKSTVGPLWRIMLVAFFVFIFFLPDISGLNHLIYGKIYPSDGIFGATIASMFFWIITIITSIILWVAVYLLLQLPFWIFTGKGISSGVTKRFFNKILSPFIFAFNFLFAKSDGKNYIRKQFRPASEKAKEKLTEDV